MPNLNKTIIENIRIPVPTDTALDKFSAIKTKIMDTKKLFLDFEDESIFESLSQKAFKGEL